MNSQIEKTAIDGLSLEVKQDNRYIYIRPIITNIHDFIETLLIEEGYQLTMHSINTTNTITKLKNGDISEKEGYRKLTKAELTLKEAIKRRKKIKETIKSLITLDETLLDTIRKTKMEEQKWILV